MDDPWGSARVACWPWALARVAAVFGDRLTKQTGDIDREWDARPQAGYGGEGGRLPLCAGRAARQGAVSVREHQTVLQRRCARDLKSTTSCPSDDSRCAAGREVVHARRRGQWRGRGNESHGERAAAHVASSTPTATPPGCGERCRTQQHGNRWQAGAGVSFALRVQMRGAGFGPQRACVSTSQSSPSSARHAG
jgi:hypothetical protein